MSRNPEHPDSGPNIPVILFVHRKDPGLVKQLYEHIIIINSDEGTAPQFFQSALENNKIEGLYGFLSEHDNFTTEESVTTIVDSMDNPYVGGVYSDNYMFARNFVPQILPAFSRDTLKSNIINTPLFISSKIAREWDTSLETAYFFDYFKKLGQTTVLAHIPEPLIVTINHHTSNEEINKIVKQYGNS